MSAIKEKSRNLRSKSAKTVQSSKLNKREFIFKFIKDPKNIVWAKEMVIVNKLVAIFPDIIFWNSLKLNFKLNSLCWFLSDDGRKFLNTEYKKFKYTPKEVSKFEFNNIDNDIIISDNSSITPEKKRNLKNFLNLW